MFLERRPNVSKKVKLADVSDFSNKTYKCLKYKNRPLGVFKEENGSFYAIEAYCKHQNALLPMNKAQGEVVTCPRHQWKFNIKTGACLNEPWASLKRFELELEGESLFLLEREEEEEDDFF